MLIGGLQKLTLIDYPGKIACTVFVVGCNFRCHFCHNPELVDPVKFKLSESIEEKKFFDFLKSRKGLLEGVCITGGEPTIHPDLPQFIKEIKALGFLVKLDTNGTSPKMIEALVSGGIVDYIAMDIKTSLQNNFYEKVVGVAVDFENIKKSIEIIMQSDLEFEFRTTVVPGLHTEENILDITKYIHGAKRYYLQQFRPSKKIFDADFREIKPYPIEFLKELRDKIKDNFDVCEVRE